MKQSLRVLTVAASLAALPGVAMAGGGDRVHRAECRAARDARHLPVYDTNRDGKIDRTERSALKQDRRQKALARFDADRDGQLSEVEWVKLRRERMAEKFGQLDRNRDGAISRSEASGPCSRLAERFDAVDQDRSGSISLSELGAARMFRKHGKHRSRPRAEPSEPAESSNAPGSDI
ncbi:MAG TPA: hypothetical protein VNO33_20070 [Kofleriaceae bacterium]|nr:hypothetical protein [Kofleriaceae bacterium]